LPTKNCLAGPRPLPAAREVRVFRLALAIVICCAPVAARWAQAATINPPHVDVVRVDTEQAKHVQIESQEVSADGRELSVVLKPIDGQFTVDFDLIGRDFKRVRITVLGLKRTEAVRYFTDIKRLKVYIDLTQLPGVNINRIGDDTVIEFATPRAAKIMPPEGRLMVKKGTLPTPGATP
jgi:hypothetical protein